MKVFATYNIKGGVGKTATAVNLAYLSALDGARTLLWDLDPQGAATWYYRIKPKVKGGGARLLRGRSDVERLIRGSDFDGLDLLPADFSYRHLDLALDREKKPSRRLAQVLAPLADTYDRVFLDCPPSISVLSEAVFRTADVLLVPTIPTTLSIRTLDQLASALEDGKASQVAVKPFFCMVDRRKKLHRELCADAGDQAFPFLETHIPYASVIERMGIERQPVFNFANRTAAARAYRSLWSELSGA